MASLEEAREIWELTKDRFQEATPTRIAYMGDGRGFATSNMIVSGKPILIYARESPDDPNFFVIQNRAVQPAFNKQVILGFLPHEPEIEQVLDFVTESVMYKQGGSAVGQTVAHRQQHEFGGGDEVFIDPRLLTIGLGRPTEPPSASIYVTPFSYYYKTWNRFSGNNTIDITRFNPTSGSRYVLVSLDPAANELTYTLGTQYDIDSSEFSDTGTTEGAGGWGFVPAPAGDEYPLFAVTLTPTTTQLNWQSGVLDNITETRLHITPPFRAVLDRLEALEGTLGLAGELTTLGAETFPTSEYIANAGLIRGVNVDETIAPTDGQSLVYEQDKNSWIADTISGAGETNTGENLGSGIGVFREKTGVNFLFKSLSPGSYTTVASGASEITIGSEAEPNTAVNLGTGIEVFREKSGVNLNLRTLVGGDNTTITSSTSLITIAGTDTSNTATNLGTGIGVFKETAASNHQFKTLVGGANITATSDASTITLTGDTNTITSGTNLGSGIATFKELAASTLQFKTIVAGTNVTTASDASTITINSTGGGGGGDITSAVNLGSGVPIFKELTASTLRFKSLSAGANIEIIPSTSVLTIRPPERMFNKLYSASAWNNLTIPIWQTPKASGIEFNQFDSTIMGNGAGASLAFTLEKRDFDGILTQGTSIFSSNQTATPGGLRSTTFNDNASILVPEQHLMFITGSGAATGGTIDFISLTGYHNFTTASPAADSGVTTAILLETGDQMLLETGDVALLEN